MLSGADLSSHLSFDVQGVAALRMKAAAGDPGTLKAAAKQFEAMLVQTMLKTMRVSHFTSDGDVFGDSSSLKLYQELLDQQWAQSITAGKGLGLADMIVKSLPAAASAPAAPASEAAKAAAALAPARPLPATVEPGAAATSQAPHRNAGGDPYPERKQRFVEAMLPYAQAAEKVSGVPARFVLAHAALESGWGQHEIMAADGTTSHNLFGIKADGGWDGKAVSSVTTEYRQGLALKMSAKFRAYADYAEGFVDYARLLKRRYRAAVAAGNDGQAFAAGLVAGGYASDPAYVGKLQGAIRGIPSPSLGQARCDRGQVLTAAAVN